MLGNRSALTPTVLVHAGNDLRSRNQAGLHTFLLDMTPSTTGELRVQRRGARRRADLHGSGGRAHHHGDVGERDQRDHRGHLHGRGGRADLSRRNDLHASRRGDLRRRAGPRHRWQRWLDRNGRRWRRWRGVRRAVAVAPAVRPVDAAARPASALRAAAAGRPAPREPIAAGGRGGRQGDSVVAVRRQPAAAGRRRLADPTGEAGTTAGAVARVTVRRVWRGNHHRGRHGMVTGGTAAVSAPPKDPLVGGCDCDASGAGGFSASGLFALGLLGIALPRARRRQVARARKVDQ